MKVSVMSERRVNFGELFNFCSPWNHLGGVQKSTSLPALYKKSILTKLSEIETEENTIVNLCKFWPISDKSISNKCVPKDSVSGIQNFTVSSHIDMFIHSFNSRFNSFYRFVFHKNLYFVNLRDCLRQILSKFFETDIYLL